VDLQPVHDDNGVLVQFMLFQQDITARKRAEELLRESQVALQRAKTEAEAASRAKSVFLANMSHEVRTPMAAIVGYAEMLLDPQLAKQSRIHVVHSICRNGEHLLGLINDMLDLSKIEAGRMEMTLQSCGLWQLITEAMSVANVRAQQKGIQLSEIPIGRLPRTITTDEVRFRQILLNLLTNAVKFTDAERSVTLRARLESSTDDLHELIIEVEDQGCGMNEETLAKLFMPFEQGDMTSSRRHEGTGLGLSITKHLVEALNGRIEVRSQVNVGTCFTVVLPVTPEEARDLVDARDLSTELSYSLPTRPFAQHLSGTILLAEDNPDNRNIIRYFLERAGVQIEVAEDGLQAVQLVQTRHYDVVIMDMQMPRFDGYSATMALREAGWRVPIVALTAHAMLGDEQKCLEAGCDAYLTKPIDASRLIATVSRYLPKREFKPRKSSTLHFPAEPPSGSYELNKLQKIYQDSLPEKFRDLRQAFTQQNLTLLARLCHDLRGSAGMYGFSAISEFAGLIEDACAEGRDADLIQELIDELGEQIPKLTH
jgi:signal transduction histidine kinase/DNA-binding response OmpR family regulator